MKHFRNIDEFERWLLTADTSDTPVWRHADGSYFVAEWHEFRDDENDDDYAPEGTVAEWKEQ